MKAIDNALASATRLGDEPTAEERVAAILFLRREAES